MPFITGNAYLRGGYNAWEEVSVGNADGQVVVDLRDLAVALRAAGAPDETWISFDAEIVGEKIEVQKWGPAPDWEPSEPQNSREIRPSSEEFTGPGVLYTVGFEKGPGGDGWTTEGFNNTFLSARSKP